MSYSYKDLKNKTPKELAKIQKKIENNIKNSEKELSGMLAENKKKIVEKYDKKMNELTKERKVLEKISEEKESESKRERELKVKSKEEFKDTDVDAREVTNDGKLKPNKKNF